MPCRSWAPTAQVQCTVQQLSRHIQITQRVPVRDDTVLKPFGGEVDLEGLPLEQVDPDFPQLTVQQLEAVELHDLRLCDVEWELLPVAAGLHIASLR